MPTLSVFGHACNPAYLQWATSMPMVTLTGSTSLYIGFQYSITTKCAKPLLHVGCIAILLLLRSCCEVFGICRSCATGQIV